MFKKTSLILLIIILPILLVIFINHQKAQAGFDRNNIIGDGTFSNINAMDAGAIQRFLEGKNSYLKDFSENGRSAAQIIRDAAHGYGEASGSICGIDVTETINPQAILVTLQKEQSLVTKTSRDDDALRKAMGYGCPDGGSCNPRYAGFTNQVEWGAWQLRYNYERSARSGGGGCTFSDYKVGQTMNFDGSDVYLSNRATASLYRYTPHLHGNENFYNIFHNWFEIKEYDAEYSGQSAYPTVNSGDTATMTVYYKNTGSTTWQKNVVNLGLVYPDFHWNDNGYVMGNYWWRYDRPATLTQDSVAPGEVGTFQFTIRNHGGLAPGNYRLDVGLVAEKITWFPPNTHAWWDVWVPADYQAQYLSQNGPPTLCSGDATSMTISYKNTGNVTWQKNVVNIGLVNPNYSWKADGYVMGNYWWRYDRPATLTQDSVAPGETGTFEFTIRNHGSLPGGNYRLDVGLVAEKITWFPPNTHAWWNVAVPDPYKAIYLGQSGNPTLHSGETANMTITYKNAGSETWQKNIVNLGLVYPDFHWKADGYVMGNYWWRYDRPATLKEDSVLPGGIGTFEFTIKNHGGLGAGNYRFDVGLVAEKITWFSSNTHAFWNVWVP